MITLHPRTPEKHAKGQRSRKNTASCSHAWLTAATPIGASGPSVTSLVAVVIDNDHVPAPTLYLSLAGSTALIWVTRSSQMCVTLDRVHNPEVGPVGQFGLPVVDHAEAEVRPEDELAPRPHPPMVGLTV